MSCHLPLLHLHIQLAVRNELSALARQSDRGTPATATRHLGRRALANGVRRSPLCAAATTLLLHSAIHCCVIRPRSGSRLNPTPLFPPDRGALLLESVHCLPSEGARCVSRVP